MDKETTDKGLSTLFDIIKREGILALLMLVGVIFACISSKYLNVPYPENAIISSIIIGVSGVLMVVKEIFKYLIEIKKLDKEKD